MDACKAVSQARWRESHATELLYYSSACIFLFVACYLTPWNVQWYIVRDS